MRKIISYVPKRIYLELLIHNKKLQKKLKISLDTYIKYSNQIEIEIKMITNLTLRNIEPNFININEKEKSYYHVYFDEGNEEIKRNYIDKNEKVSKIKVLIDMEVTSLWYLFCSCDQVKEIKFIKFNRIDFTDYREMFSQCKNLINLDIAKLKTDNVTDMNSMFYFCGSLKTLNLSNFKTNNVTTMDHMFENCYSLEKLDLSNFRTDKVQTMQFMFHYCKSLKELNLSNFEFDNSLSVDYMFSYCSSELKAQIKNKFRNINDEAFDDYDEGDWM